MNDLLDQIRSIGITVLAVVIGVAILWIVAKLARWHRTARTITGLVRRITGGGRQVATATGADERARTNRRAAAVVRVSLVLMIAAVLLPLWGWVVAITVLLLVACAGEPTFGSVAKHIRARWASADQGGSPVALAAFVALLASVPAILLASEHLDLEVPDIGPLEAGSWLRVAAAAQVAVAWTVGRVIRSKLAGRGRDLTEVQVQAIYALSDGEMERHQTQLSRQPDGSWVATNLPPGVVAQRDAVDRRAWEYGFRLAELSTHRSLLEIATADDAAERELLAATGGVLRAMPTVPTVLAADAEFVYAPGRGMAPARRAPHGP